MAKSRSSSSPRGRTQSRGAAAHTTDHEEIKRWVEERRGKPACVKGTQRGDSCLLRIDFPGGAGAESLEDMSWDDFFDVMDKRGLVFLYQKGKSTFNKIVTPDSIEEREQRGRGGRSRGRSASGGRKSSTRPHGRGST
jgi:hypothetical protein